ncbi:hypothetical protein [Streptomyces ziwulingensis]|uniref:Secreted protein n=1 Tax=Streptomyces ziwulingensis TaxID=1045501 RepID=A0ABP9D3Z6_9ACTN
MAMPRPTVAQLAYGSCTVVLSTLAMLLLSRTSSSAGIAVVAVAALALGVLVAMTLPTSTPRTVAAHRPARPAAEAPVPVSSGAAGEAVRQRAA